MRRHLPPLLVLLALPTAAVESPHPVVEGAERVTAIDVLVEAPGAPGASPDDPARTLDRGELELSFDGAPLPVVAVQGGAGAQQARWQVVVVVDPVLAEDETLRWVAVELGERVHQLLALGEVEIARLASDGVRPLARSADGFAALEDAFSGLAVFDEDEDEILALRGDFLRLAGDLEAAERDELAAAAAHLEARAVVQRLDRLLLHLAGRSQRAERRLLLLVSDGWDLSPERFYGGDSDDGEGLLTEPTQVLAQELSAHGWLVVPLTHPPRKVARGIRIGKAFIQLPDADDAARLGGWPFFKLTWEEHRDPKLAAGHLANGKALLESGAWEAARDALGRAAFHYGEDPRTFPEKARALRGLAEAYAALGDSEEARRAASEALRLDPSLAETDPAPSFADPGAALGLLAAESAGAVVRTPAELATVLDHLHRRLRVTAQLAGPPDGALHAVEVRRGASGRPLSAPRWVRWGPSPGVAAARARTALDDQPETADLRLRRHPGQPIEAIAPAEWLETAEHAPLCRLTVAWGDPARPPELWQGEPVPCGETPLRVPPVGDSEEGVAVVLEELERGEWRRAWVAAEE